MSADCLFCKIVEGKIPAKRLFEDDQCLCFADINPQSPAVDGLHAPAHRLVEQLTFAVVDIEHDVGVVWHMGSHYTPARPGVARGDAGGAFSTPRGYPE